MPATPDDVILTEAELSIIQEAVKLVEQLENRVGEVFRDHVGPCKNPRHWDTYAEADLDEQVVRCVHSLRYDVDAEIPYSIPFAECSTVSTVRAEMELQDAERAAKEKAKQEEKDAKAKEKRRQEYEKLREEFGE